MKKLLTILTGLMASLAIANPGAAMAASGTAFNPQLVGTVGVSQVGDSQMNQKWTLMSSGSESPLGNFMYSSALVVHMENGMPMSGEGQGTFMGVGNNDSINFNLKLMFLTPTTTNPDVTPFTGTFTVTGGTGKFQGVHGDGTINPGGANLSAGTFFGNWGGNLTSKTL